MCRRAWAWGFAEGAGFGGGAGRGVGVCVMAQDGLLQAALSAFTGNERHTQSRVFHLAVISPFMFARLRNP